MVFKQSQIQSSGMRLVKFSYINPEVHLIPKKTLHHSEVSINPTPAITFRYFGSQSKHQCITPFHKDDQSIFGNSRLDVSGVHMFAQQEAKINAQIQMLRVQLQQSRQQFAALMERKAQTRITINNSLNQTALAQMQLQTAYLTRQQGLNTLRQLLHDIQFA